MANSSVTVKKDKKPKAAKPKKEKKPKTDPLEETPRPIETTPTSVADGDGYVVDLDAETKITVKHFRGRIYIDIRKFWNDAPTRKGISLTPELFQKLQQWTGLEAALKAVGEH